MPASLDYTDFKTNRYRGETIQYDIVVTLEGVPLPITGLSEIWFTAKLNDNQADPGVFQKTLTDGSIVATDAPNGEARITIAPADTSAFDNMVTLLCDLKVKEASDGRETVERRGKLTIRPTPTKTV